MESITFDTKNNKIIVCYSDESIKEYAEKDVKKYVNDTQRLNDAIAMGWITEA
jgi:hypothetical protein